MASSRDDVASSSRARITPYPTQAERQLAAELERQAATEEERERLRADLVRQETERKNASQRKRALAAKLKGMENKLLKGGTDSEQKMSFNLTWSRRWRRSGAAPPRRRRRVS